MASALVFVVTGIGWAAFEQLRDGLSTADVTGGFKAADGVTDILLVGNSSRTDAQGNPLPPEVLARLGASAEGGQLSDTVILLRIPNDGRRAVAISLPRDLYVDMPDGYGRHKLNSAFPRARNETASQMTRDGTDPAAVREESTAAGRRLLVETVEGLTGVDIEHYAELNLLGFARLTEAVGGVEVCLTEPVDDPKSGAEFPAGPQTISGTEALAFVRQRYGLPRGDLDRIVRQQVFLAALADKVLSAGTLTDPGRIRELIDATQQALVLDKDLDVLDFAARMQGIASGDIRFVTVPIAGPEQVAGEGEVLTVDRAAVRQFVNAVIRPDPNGEPNPAAGEPEVNVDVFNTTSIDGMAGRVSDTLGGDGFEIGAVANAAPRQTTVVRYAPGAQDTGDSVSQALGDLPLHEDTGLKAGHLQLYLADDYTGPERHTGDGGSGSVDGTSAQDHTPPEQGTAGAQAAPAPAPPIDADDVPCVN